MTIQSQMSLKEFETLPQPSSCRLIDFILSLNGTIGTKGIEVIGANCSQTIPISEKSQM
jgi:hypothetical protein